MNLIDAITTTENMQAAWEWLVSRRGESHYNNDFWFLSERRHRIQNQVISDLKSGQYHFKPCRVINGMSIWSSQDAWVLKAVALVLTKFLKNRLSPYCYHLPERGGTKAYIRQTQACVRQFKFVCRSDVNSYYANVNHCILMRQLKQWIKNDTVLLLIERMLNRLDECNGKTYTIDRGLSKGNPLSPVLGAVYLYELDHRIGTYLSLIHI